MYLQGYNHLKLLCPDVYKGNYAVPSSHLYYGGPVGFFQKPSLLQSPQEDIQRLHSDDMQMREWLSMWHGTKVLENRLFLYIAYLVGDGTHEEGDDKLQSHA
jgi:hypothetical protein